MDGNSGGNEVHISEGNVPGASSEWVEPNYDQEDENMLSQLLEESGSPSLPFQESLVDNQASTGSYHVEPYPPISQGFTCNQDFVCQSSPGVEASGGEENPHHGITPGQQYLLKELFDFYSVPVEEYWSQAFHHYPPIEKNLFEESGSPSLSFQESLVDNQASTGSYHVEPYPPISQGFTCNQNFVYQSSPAYGSEANPHHGITPNQHDLPKELFDFDKDPVDEYWGQTIRDYPPVEENVMPSWPWYHHNAHADEAGSSNEQQYRFDRH
ncbi:hypothetical protein SeLEV6574_g03954 [Synchytrium endobioticum]|uniref:Uncharacterized protein n=1 Tax=Synchytrium endobioticum TaxID=286115 RepID=A0A507D1J2_9FUNG|nr:hypothetical protein SeLEV6574_g03954 [Synchytrium endobioticum]